MTCLPFLMQTVVMSHVASLPRRTLPGPVEGREWAQQRREKLLEAPKADKRAMAMSVKPDFQLGNFCWGPILGVKDTNGTTGWWFGINIFFLFHPYLGKIFFNLASYFFKFGLKPPNLTIPVQNDSWIFFDTCNPVRSAGKGCA